MESSGLHTNGYSLARKIFFDGMGLRPTSKIPELGMTLGEELLKVHVSYGALVQSLIKKFNTLKQPPKVKAFAHITGGGFIDNIPRVLPKGCDVRIEKGSWEMLPVFRILQQKGGVDEFELYQVFNMGIGMVTIVAADAADSVLRSIRRTKQNAWVIGEVVKGTGKARVE
jgi:phosphoribosylformylglycinamidine cyclo-ligase